MTSLHQRHDRSRKPEAEKAEKLGADRRTHRRHDMHYQGITVQRWDGSKRNAKELGHIVDLSAGGVRVRTSQGNIQPDHQIRVRLELPAYAGICPFVDTTGVQPEPRRDWVGWMSVSRVQKLDSANFDISGRLVDMEEIDRGMLGLYLSTQPMAA